jgi:hypothetical protein
MFPNILVVILAPQHPYTVPVDIGKTRGEGILSHASEDATYYSRSVRSQRRDAVYVSLRERNYLASNLSQ